MSWLRRVLKVATTARASPVERKNPIEHWESEIASLKSSIRALEEVQSLQNTLAAVKPPAPPAFRHQEPPTAESQKTRTTDDSQESEAVASLRSTISALQYEVQTLRWALTSLTDSLPASNTCSFSDDSFSLCFYGIPEYPKGTTFKDRFELDIQACMSVISSIDSTITSESFWGMRRLGEYSDSSERPRPLKVRFVRASDAARILLNRKLIAPPVSVRPHLPLETRLQYKILGMEKKSLIDSGILRNSIKISPLEKLLLVDGRIYGRLDSNNNFKREEQGEPYNEPPVNKLRSSQ